MNATDHINVVFRKFAYSLMGSDNTAWGSYCSAHQAVGKFAEHHIDMVSSPSRAMSRAIASPSSIVTAIVNSDAYHQSPLMDKWESMLYE